MYTLLVTVLEPPVSRHRDSKANTLLIFPTCGGVRQDEKAGMNKEVRELGVNSNSITHCLVTTGEFFTLKHVPLK